MKIEGNLRDFGLEAIFQLINSEKQTGTLHITRKTGDAEGFVYFRDGKIFGAVSNFNRQPLGERLVNAGHITEEQLNGALGKQRKAKKRQKLGQMLISENLITSQILKTFVKEQIQNTVFDLLPWVDGDFKFFEDQLPASEDMGLMLSARKILQKSGDRLDEWERLGTRVPSLGSLFRRLPEAEGEAEAAGFSRLHLQVSELIDGTMTVSQVAKTLGVTEFETASALYDLSEVGLVQLVGAEGEAAPDDLSPEGRAVDPFDAMEELELSPDDVISDRASFTTELISLTDGSSSKHKSRNLMQAASKAVLIERVHLDRTIGVEALNGLTSFIKEH